MNLLNKLRYVPKRFAAIAAITLAVAVPAVLFAWGPSRDTFTVAHPANYVTFNSITDNPIIGDEREFVSIKDAAITTDGGWKDSTTVEPGKEYLVRVYVHNNAADNLNLKAINTRVSATVPTNTSKSNTISGFVSADNAQPQRVWDDITLTSDKDFNLVYVPGSAEIYNNGYAAGGQGQALPDSIVTGAGALVGYNGPDGVVPGCFQYANYVYFKVKPQFAQSSNFEMNKTVRINGDTDKTFKENVTVNPGDKVDFQVYYKNTGASDITNVVVKDQLPAGMTYVAGSTWLHNANGTRQVADGVTTGGIMIGNYAPNGDAYVKFTAQIAANDYLSVCGNNTLKNIAKVETDQGGKQDDATVTVPKECAPEVKYSCDALTVDKISRTQFTFKESHTVQNATYVRTVFIVRDANGTELTRVNSQNSSYTYNQSKTGKYSVEAQVVVSVNGQEKVATSDNCKKAFEVVEQPVTPVYECTALELIKKSRDSFEFKTTARAEGNVTIKEVSVDFGDNAKQTVDYGKNAAHTYAAPGTYTAVSTVVFNVDGKTVNKTSDTCKVSVVVEQPPVVPPVTPGTPSELPSTGPESVIGGLFGSSALGLGVTSFIRSRRALRDTLNR